MSTNARIGFKNQDGSITSVYHHWDGYPEWLGKKLTEKYTDAVDIIGLLRGGDISCIDSDTDWNREKCAPRVLYYNERGENTQPQRDKNLAEYLDNMDYSGAEYAYVFMGDIGWVCFDYNKDVVPM